MSVAYRQCRLTRPGGRVVEQLTTWLPEPFAVAGAAVRLPEPGGGWGESWDVASVGPFTISEDSIRKAERAYTRRRRGPSDGRGDGGAVV